jgi:L-lactate dehydrogenase complex protein LldG
MNSRQDILGRIRQRLGRTGDKPTALAAAPGASASHPRPTIVGDLRQRFVDQSLAQSTTVDCVMDWQQVPDAVARYLSATGRAKQVVGWPLLAGHPWSAAGIEFDGRGARDGDTVGITGCYCAIAETGTLMVLSGPETPATVSLLPETHVAIVAASRVVAGMEEAWQLVRAERAELPRAVNFISGPSRTGDIEQTIVLGAHGPYRVHVVLVSAA